MVDLLLFTVAVLRVCCCLNTVRWVVLLMVALLWLLCVVILLLLSSVWVLLLFAMRVVGCVLGCGSLYALVVLFVLVGGLLLLKVCSFCVD